MIYAGLSGFAVASTPGCIGFPLSVLDMAAESDISL